MIHQSAAIWLCYAVLHVRCSTVSSPSVSTSHRHVVWLIHLQQGIL